MRTSCFLLLLLLSNLNSSAQNCSCVTTFDRVVSYVERNYAGSKDKINSQTKRSYIFHTATYRRMARQVKKDAGCLYAINQWLEFFKDHHIALSPGTNADSTSLQKAIASTETIALPPPAIAAMRAQKGNAGIEGIYANDNYEVAVVKNDNGFRSYAAIILSSKVKEWQPGQVKFELVKKSGNEFGAIWYYKDHHPEFGTVRFDEENGLLKEGWNKLGYKPSPVVHKPLFEEELTAPVYFKKLDAIACYLRIKSFDIDLYKMIDSVVNTNLPVITSTPQLIIDLRYNGGGGDRSYRTLRPLIYTQPVKTTGVDLWVTPDNIAANERLFAANENIPKDYIAQYRAKVKEVPQGSSGYVNVYNDRTDTLTNTPHFPEKVAILINNRCGSTTEQFLLEARQSKKVVLMGEHTQGVLDYANMRDKDFSCPAFTLGYATTRSRRLNEGQGIDNKGIEPHIQLDFSGSSWLNEVREKLQQQALSNPATR
ncbi:hypothetical protein LL912_17815 [Niabella sp. CC-SYL272]|uniref:S41 family peptidase n=1 Tax=Niabella agricola TaxID=2891571 RepID=UPI001F3B08FB|nr:S41 family peptidase [Niabella agricola]MCF3110645.1 hypothetical protein [Niabella agricola]